MSDNKLIYWFHGDVCLNIQYSDNLPASDNPYVIDEMIDEGTTIKHRLKYNGHTRNVVVPKKDNAVHKFLEDGRRESVKFVAAGKHQYCTRKQHEKIISIKK
jgi:hypothetical protein